MQLFPIVTVGAICGLVFSDEVYLLLPIYCLATQTTLIKTQGGEWNHHGKRLRLTIPFWTAIHDLRPALRGCCLALDSGLGLTNPLGTPIIRSCSRSAAAC